VYALSRPGPRAIASFLARQGALPWSYAEVGATRAGAAPAGYAVDHNRRRIGAGAADFERARAAIRRWSMFDLGWVEIHPRAPAIEPGTSVAILVRALGCWSLNASRIVYAVDERGAERRFGFAYGTLPDHAERGEERFTVEWRADDSVWYDLFAFSRPNQAPTRALAGWTRRMQGRFAAGSLAAMQRAVEGTGGPRDG